MFKDWPQVIKKQKLLGDIAILQVPLTRKLGCVSKKDEAFAINSNERVTEETLE